MLRLALVLFFLSAASAYAEEGFLPYDTDIAVTGTISFSGGTAEIHLDKPVTAGVGPADQENGDIFHDVTVMQIVPRDGHVANRLLVFQTSRVNIRGSVSPPLVAGQDVVLNATEVIPVKANGSP